MPRDPSGNYTLPAGNPVVSGTIIEATWANTTLSDIENELTDSLSRTGEGGMLAPLKFPNGSETAPSITFINDPLVGFFYDGSRLNVATSGGFNFRWILGGAEILSGATWYKVLHDEDREGFYTIGLDPTLSDEECGLTVGTDNPADDPHLAFGPTAIQAKTDGTSPASLSIQPLAGDLRLGSQSGGGEVYVYTFGAQRVFVNSAGRVYIQADTTGGRSELILSNQLLDDRATLGFNGSSSELALRNDENGGNLRISTTEPGGTARTKILCEATGTVGLYFGTVRQAYVVPEVDGGLKANNQLTGDGDERVLTESDGFNVARITSDQSVSGTTTTTLTGWHNVLPTTADALYAVEGQMVVYTNGTGGLTLVFSISTGYEYRVSASWNNAGTVYVREGQNTIIIDQTEMPVGNMVLTFTASWLIGPTPTATQAIVFAQTNAGATANTTILQNSWIRSVRLPN